MKIRSRLLLLLLPTLTAFLALVALFFYFNWSNEILDGFKDRLRSIVTASADSIDSKEIAWIKEHIDDPDLVTNPIYIEYRNKLLQLKKKLPIYNFFIVKIEPVKDGEYVLKNDGKNELNEIHEANDQSTAYRQVLLLDTNKSDSKFATAPGDFDFSETDEHVVYFTKKSLVTPIYEARKTHERFMSAYAPILDNKGEVVALLGADESTKIIDQKLSNAILIMSLGGLGTLILLILTLFLIANLISKPVQALNKAALAIAAGDYESNIHLEGPREIVELANTLNTMSECLVENIDRLKESSLVRERMYGEYECALLLQHYMLQKVVDDFKNPNLKMRLISANSASNQSGILLKIEPNEDLHFTLVEAKTSGFAGLFELNQMALLPIESFHEENHTDCHFTDNFTKMDSHSYNLSPPLVWSTKSDEFITPVNHQYILQNKDMIFLYNTGLVDLFHSEERVAAWFSKALRHFAQDGLETIQTMLSNEIEFIAKKQGVSRNYQIISLQVNIPETTPRV
jgi:HAMP domain-containing protein